MNNIIVALDGLFTDEAWQNAISLAEKLQGKVWGFKVNDGLFYEPKNCSRLLPYGKLMLDPKLHDTPSTMRNAVRQLLVHGPSFLTIHAGAGAASMKAAVEVAGECKIIAVTVLTTIDDQDCRNVFGGLCGGRENVVWRLADLAFRSGVHGVVCGSDDLKSLPAQSSSFIKICPGIRPDGRLEGDDQVQIGVGEGADFLVVGRPITQASDPLAVVEKIYGKKE